MIDEKKWLLRTVTVLLALIVAGIFTLAVMFAPRAEQKRYYYFNYHSDYAEQFLFDPTTGDLYRRADFSGPTWEPVCSFPATATAEKIRLRTEEAKAEAAAEKSRQRTEAERATD